MIGWSTMSQRVWAPASALLVLALAYALQRVDIVAAGLVVLLGLQTAGPVIKARTPQGILGFALPVFIGIAVLAISQHPWQSALPWVIACWVATMTTAVRALCTRREDQFWLAPVTAFLVWKIMDKSLLVVYTDLASLHGSVLLAFAILWPNRKLDSLSILASGLLLNATMRLLDWHWGIPLVACMLFFNYGGVIRERHLGARFGMRTVFHALLSVLVWVIASNLVGPKLQNQLLLPFLINMAGLFGIGWGKVHKKAHPGMVPSMEWLARLLRALVLMALLIPVTLPFAPHLASPLAIFIFLLGTILTDALHTLASQRFRAISGMHGAFVISVAVSIAISVLYR